MAGFLSKFPGFDDQSNVQTKLYEVFDRIVRAASKDAQSYTADIEPWFGGQIAMGSPTIGQGGGRRHRSPAWGADAAVRRDHQGPGQSHGLADEDTSAIR